MEYTVEYPVEYPFECAQADESDNTQTVTTLSQLPTLTDNRWAHPRPNPRLNGLTPNPSTFEWACPNPSTSEWAHPCNI